MSRPGIPRGKDLSLRHCVVGLSCEMKVFLFLIALIPLSAQGLHIQIPIEKSGVNSVSGIDFSIKSKPTEADIARCARERENH